MRHKGGEEDSGIVGDGEREKRHASQMRRHSDKRYDRRALTSLTADSVILIPISSSVQANHLSSILTRSTKMGRERTHLRAA